MWLIDSANLSLVEVADSSTVEYAILSHTWGKDEEEVGFEEFMTQTATSKRGWEKIQKTCSLAMADNYGFVWCDTCCINKSSSAELTEAINSMFRWYANSGICYVYLADYDQSKPGSTIGAARWFTRGWTLQELIAPTQVRFFDASWAEVGTKSSLCNEISEITGIEQKVLQASEGSNLDDILGQVPVARRMAWAAGRQTTRVEDIAYCLLGLFGVNLPLLYGSGERAFIRLQEEIIKDSNDLSLFAWRSARNTSSNSSGGGFSGVFASHPGSFRESRNLAMSSHLIFDPEFTLTNKGIRIESCLSYFEDAGIHGMFLNCHDTTTSYKQLGIFLKHQGASVFARARPHEFMTQQSPTSERKSFFLSKSLGQSIAKSLYKVHRCAFLIPNLPYSFKHWTTSFVEPKALWDGGQRMFITTGLNDFVGCHAFGEISLPTEDTKNQVFLFFGYGYGFHPWLRVIRNLNIRCILAEVDRGNWKAVADSVMMLGGEVSEGTLFVEFQTAYKASCLKAKLVTSVQNGEPVFFIKYGKYTEDFRSSREKALSS